MNTESELSVDECGCEKWANLSFLSSSMWQEFTSDVLCVFFIVCLKACSSTAPHLSPFGHESQNVETFFIYQMENFVSTNCDRVWQHIIREQQVSSKRCHGWH